MQPHRRKPTRLPRPWDSLGKNTAMGCHFLLQSMKGKSESEVTQSCPTLRDPMVCSLPGSSVHGIFQARVLEWGAIAFSIFFKNVLSIPQWVRYPQKYPNGGSFSNLMRMWLTWSIIWQDYNLGYLSVRTTLAGKAEQCWAGGHSHLFDLPVEPAPRDTLGIWGLLRS